MVPSAPSIGCCPNCKLLLQHFCFINNRCWLLAAPYSANLQLDLKQEQQLQSPVDRLQEAGKKGNKCLNNFFKSTSGLYKRFFDRSELKETKGDGQSANFRQGEGQIEGRRQTASKGQNQTPGRNLLQTFHQGPSASSRWHPLSSTVS